MDDLDAHRHFDEFLKGNEWYANALDFVLEDYYFIFKKGLEKGFDLGVDQGTRDTLYNCNPEGNE